MFFGSSRSTYSTASSGLVDGPILSPIGLASISANAKEIADFLSGANPYLPQATLLSLLATHGAHHMSQIQQIESGDKAGEAKTWDAMKAHMNTIADALAGGIARQFPDKAKG